MTQNKLPEGWQEVGFLGCLDKEASNNKLKLQQKEFLEEGKYPIIDQGEEFIAGYTNDESKIYSEKLPVVIFGDHTRIFKFVNFQFALGADGVKILVPNKYVNAKYLYYGLNKLKIPSAGYSRHYKFLKELKIPFPFKNGKPDLERQKKIVSILEKAERLKQKRQGADKLIQEYLKAVFYEMFGDPVKNEKKWRLIRLEDISEEIQPGFAYGQFSDNEGVVHIRPFNISPEGFLDLNQIKYVPKEAIKSERYILSKGNLIVNTTNSLELVGKTTLFNLNKKYCFSNHMTKISLNKSITNSHFLWFVLNRYWKANKFSNLIKSWVNQVGIDSYLLKNLKIPLPPLPLQQKFARIVERVEKMKEKQKQSKEKIDELFNSLMQKAFNGELV